MLNNVLLPICIAIGLNLLCLSGWLLIVYRQHQYLKSIKGKTVLMIDGYGTFVLEVSENGIKFNNPKAAGGGAGTFGKIAEPLI